jgi:hypothetical protein
VSLNNNGDYRDYGRTIGNISATEAKKILSLKICLYIDLYITFENV